MENQIVQRSKKQMKRILQELKILLNVHHQNLKQLKLRMKNLLKNKKSKNNRTKSKNKNKNKI